VKKSNIITKIFNRLVRYVSFLKFKIKHPSVRVVKPLYIGTFYSQDGQDIYLSSLLFNFLNNNLYPWVVDVGCNHPSHYSNTLFFEKWLGCRTLAIDPLEEFGDMWASQRPAAKFISTAVGSNLDSVTLSIPKGEMSDNMFSTVTGGVNKSGKLDYQERTVQCLPLSRILSEQGITEVLLISIDVEGVELDVLKSINFEKVMIRCFVIENNSNDLYGSNDIRKYLIERGYVFYARIGFLDDVFVHRSMISGHQNSLLV
jgi:FkbM family methyltransferase